MKIITRLLNLLRCKQTSELERFIESKNPQSVLDVNNLVHQYHRQKQVNWLS